MGQEEPVDVYEELEPEIGRIEQLTSRYRAAIDHYFAINRPEIDYIGREVTVEDIAELNQKAVEALKTAEEGWHRLNSALERFEDGKPGGEDVEYQDAGELEERYGEQADRLWTLMAEVSRSDVLPGDPETEGEKRLTG
ncbi:MAG: hypothetical protein ABEJ66_00570 [Candidatus Nanohaloarchaea archaeon]